MAKFIKSNQNSCLQNLNSLQTCNFQVQEEMLRSTIAWCPWILARWGPFDYAHTQDQESIVCPQFSFPENFLKEAFLRNNWHPGMCRREVFLSGSVPVRRLADKPQYICWYGYVWLWNLHLATLVYISVQIEDCREARSGRRSSRSRKSYCKLTWSRSISTLARCG